MAIRIDKFMKQILVFWERLGTNGSGLPTYKVAVELACRWDTRIEQVITPSARTIVSNAHLIVPKLMKVSSIVFLGTLADWRALPTYPAIPTVLQGGYEVVLSYHTPDIKGNPLLYEARI